MEMNIYEFLSAVLRDVAGVIVIGLLIEMFSSGAVSDIIRAWRRK